LVVNDAFLTRLSSNSSLASNASLSFGLFDCFAFDVTDGFCKLFSKIYQNQNYLLIK
jgi:hypothetical protein